MYVLKPGVKRDPVRRWALPDRIFFGHGACHILAGVYLEAPPFKGLYGERIEPLAGAPGSHVYVTDGVIAFDYHGYTRWSELLEHTKTKARRLWPGWDCALTDLPMDVLVSGPKSRTYEGLWLREPKQFLHDAMPRAETFVARFPPPPMAKRD